MKEEVSRQEFDDLNKYVIIKKESELNDKII